MNRGSELRKRDADTLAEQAALTETAKGFSGSLTLPDGLRITLAYVIGEQYTVSFDTP